ncbi:MAG TPA: type IV toxin-antitoxin system AbiEi family antitoxin [Gammaproteobacteria bacterium]|nr:type IV toxin-antitoxin system AbiEi family antitoxin [Gammaproteobacteria bacterium]HRA42861.1 type IV toxin-antitoxin system AbiEi family antitoxin [Gammaproteobacteria bacterium]
MKYKEYEKNSLSAYLDKLQSRGFYSFTKSAALPLLRCTEKTFERAAGRLIQKDRLLSIKPGFFIIVPLEYKTWGSLPPEWFIKDLMAHLELPYYVGLLSAAALYGATHQAPQQFQVMTNTVVSSIIKKKLNIRFFKNQRIEQVLFKERQTQTGTLRVSTPEATALDLVSFYKSSGYFSHIATVLSELEEKLNPDMLIETAQKGEYEWPVIQRLGYLLSLEEVCGREDLLKPLAKWIADTKPRHVPLAPYKAYQENERESCWRIFINESIEVD